MLLVLGILAGCRQGGNDVSTTRSPVAPLEVAGHPSQAKTTAATWEARYAKLQHQIEQGYYEKVIPDAEQAYNATVAGDRLWAWRFRVLQAKATLRTNDIKGALVLLKMEQPSGLPVEDFTKREFVQAYAMNVQGKLNEALAALNRVKAMLPPPSTEPDLNAEWLIFRGMFEPRDSESRHAYLMQAVTLAHGRNKYLESSAETNIGTDLLDQKHFDEAIDHFKNAYSLAKEADFPVLQEIDLVGLTNGYFELGDYLKAEQYARSGERLALELGRLDHRMSHLVNIGRNEANRGNYAQAMEIYQQTLSLARKDFDKKNDLEKKISNDVIAACLKNMADLDPGKFEEYSRQAATLKLPSDQAFLWQLNRVDVNLSHPNPDTTSAESVLAGLLAQKNLSPDQLWRLQDRKAKLYEVLQQTSNAEQWYRKAIDTAVERSKTLNRQEYKISFLSNLPFYNNYIEFLIRSNQPNRALQVAEIGRAKVLAKASSYNPASDNTTAWLARIQNELKRSNKVILAYWVSQSQLYTWIITPSEIQFVHQPRGRPELAKLVQAYQKEIDDHRKIDQCPAATTLYQILVEPMQAYLPKNSHAIIVADGILYDVNFESLIVSQPRPHYWIEDVEVENAISVQQATTTSRQPPRYEKELLAIGAPVPSQEFSLLPHAPDEIKLVTSTFALDRQRVIKGEQATPQAFFNSSPDSYRYIHFVAHGTKVATEPLDSAIILSPDENHSYKLYARDIARLKRPLRAQLVTISSCDSAGVYSHERGGLFGLSWAFTHAGAKNVVAALWKVDDATMPELMGTFYSGMAKGKPTSEALRDAKLSFLRSTSARKKPYYWATLQLYGGS